MRRLIVAVLAMLLPVTACASSGTVGQPTGGSLTLYTSVTQQTVNAVVAGYRAAHPGSQVSVFRATTGTLNARLAAEQRAGGVRADIIWGTDPLSMQSYAAQHLLRARPLPSSEVPSGLPTGSETGYVYPTRLLYLVIVAHKGLHPLPRAWSDLVDPRYRGQVALPDPATAGSAFAALGYFSQAPGLGVGFYRRLKANGAVQVGTIPEVVTDVADGRYQLGITLDSEVRSASAEGSPVTMVWPEPGAIALYSPIAVTAASKHAAAASAFLSYVLSPGGQRRIAATGWQPALAGIPGPPMPAGARTVSPDWLLLFGQQQRLLSEYQAIFGP